MLNLRVRVGRFVPGKKHFVNVGSTGHPRYGDNRSCFAVLGRTT